MTKAPRIAVTSKSFSKNELLRSELLKFFPQSTFNDAGKFFSKEELIAHLKNHDGAVVGLDKIHSEILSELPELKIVSKYGVGLDNINQEDCKNHEVAVGWTGGVNKLSVAEQAVGLMVSLMRNLFFASYQLKSGTWDKNGGRQLTEKTIGIIGVGFVGKEIIRLLKPFNCKILVNDILDQTEYYKENNVTHASKEEIFKEADIISINTPLTEETHHLVNENTLRIMKDDAFVLNTARGGIIDLEALKIALKNNTIAGAAIDVYPEEPPKDMELLSLPNLICTPHIGGNSGEAIEAMGLSAIKHLKEFFNIGH